MPARGLEVLVVEDEPLVAMVVEVLLRGMGHRVTACLDGNAALAAFREKEFDLALVDLVMPEMDGWEVCSHINRMGPEVPVILTSGKSINVEDGRKSKVRISAVLEKPFGHQQLLDAIEEAMASARQR
jgi:CheY-like chemotaxis protein